MIFFQNNQDKVAREGEWEVDGGRGKDKKDGGYCFHLFYEQTVPATGFME